MVRRALFVLVLVGAAFAGGAAINGPGLAWLHRTFAGGPTIIVDNPPAPAPAPTAKKKPPSQFPAAKTPTLQVDLAEAVPPKKPAAPALAPEAGPDLPPEFPSTPASALTRIPGAPTPAPEPLPTPSIAQTPPPAPMPSSALPASDPLASLDPRPSPKTDAVARLASAERPAADAPAMSPTPPRDWGDLRHRMKTLGIARYAIEAETEGHVKFSCVIPVDGLRAVGYHFETEGDDEYQAVEAALKRVALWRATSSPQD